MKRFQGVTRILILTAVLAVVSVMSCSDAFFQSRMKIRKSGKQATVIVTKKGNDVKMTVVSDGKKYVCRVDKELPEKVTEKEVKKSLSVTEINSEYITLLLNGVKITCKVSDNNKKSKKTAGLFLNNNRHLKKTPRKTQKKVKKQLTYIFSMVSCV